MPMVAKFGGNVRFYESTRTPQEAIKTDSRHKAATLRMSAHKKGDYYCAKKQNLFQKEIVIIGRLKQNFDLKKLFNTHNRYETWNIYIPPFINLSKIKAVTSQLGISDVNKEEYGYYFIAHKIKSDPYYRQTMSEIRGILSQDGWSFTLSITAEREFCLYLKFR